MRFLTVLVQMATAVASECNGVSRTYMGSYDGSYTVQENKDLGDDILDDFDSYMEDINERLTISRMVSDSVIKGMVNAVSQEAAEVVAAKELEVAQLKETLHYHHFGGGGFGACVSPGTQEQNLQMHGMYSCVANGFVEPDNLRESLCFLSQAAQEQLERLGEHIANPKGANCPKISSASDIDGAFYSLKATLEAMSQQVHAISSEDWKLDFKIREEVEAMVFYTIFESIQEDYERRLWDVSTVLSLVDRFKEISSLRHELDSLQKCSVTPEHGHLSAQGSQEIDLFHRKVLSTHGLPCGSLWDGNGNYEESKSSMPENLETSKLNHMRKEELYQYFRTEITKMKRDHESTVQQMTEEYFTLKREFLKEKELLKERGPFAAFRKDKDFEMLRKKISEVILKLDGILTGSERLSEFCNHSRDILDSLLSENHRLRGVLNDKKLEVYNLSSQASDATKKLSQHSLAEDNLHKLIEHLKSCLEDAHIETSISEEVGKCTLRELTLRIKSDCEDLDMKSVIMQDIIRSIYVEAVHDAEVAITSDRGEISDVECALMLQIFGIVFQEPLSDMFVELSELKKKCLKKDESLVSLESKASEIEKELQMEIEDNKKLNNQIALLENSIEVKDKSLVEITVALEETKQQFEVANEENRNLRTNNEALISDRNELVLVRDKLEYCQKQIDLYEIEVAKLNEVLELSESKSRKSGEEHGKFILQQEQNNLAMLEAKEREHRKQMELVVLVIQGLSKSFSEFELRATESIRWHNVRLENSSFQLRSLTPKVNILRRTGLLYKERLEKRFSDLQKAESEVDLLGDEVDALVSLLEKIYVAIDHYSPILQHYPGIMEILELIRRELSGEAIKAIRPAAQACI